MNDSYNTELNL